MATRHRTMSRYAYTPSQKEGMHVPHVHAGAMHDYVIHSGGQPASTEGAYHELRTRGDLFRWRLGG